MADARGTVIFTGENPGLALYAPGNERPAILTSYWRCTYSPHGEGNALIVCADAPALGTWRAIYADNAALGRFVAETLTQHFDEFAGQEIAPVPVQPGRFFQESDSRRYHRVVCHGEDRAIELVWREIRDRQPLHVAGMALGPNTFDLATVICPCGEATATIDGTPVPGTVRESTNAAGRPRSSAFLAFAESWVQHAS